MAASVPLNRPFSRAGDYLAKFQPKTGFKESLIYLLTACSVLFIGYGIRDEYVFEMLKEGAAVRSRFGDGPHFLVSPGARPELPRDINLIQYSTDFHTRSSFKHSCSRTSRQTKVRETNSFSRAPLSGESSQLRSAHLLSDFYPAGTWTSGNLAALKDSSGERNVADDHRTGLGNWGDLTNSHGCPRFGDWSPLLRSSSGFPLECISRVFNMVGGSRFEALVADDVLQFVHWEGFDSVWLESDDIGFGYLATGQADGGDPGKVIRQQFSPAPGKEVEGVALISQLERKAKFVDLSGGRNFADVCNGLFVSPTTRTLLGLSEATPAGRIPRWVAHPALRLVQIARIGATCQRLDLGSMKLMTGAAKAAEVAFSAVAGGILASEPGSYALTGQFGTIEENAFKAQPGMWDSIIQFRERSAGVAFRQEILKRLMKNEGAEIIPSIDASLHQTLPASVLTSARIEMSDLLVSNGIQQVVPAVWSDVTLLESGLKVWRKRSRERLETFLTRQGIGAYDLCPCGSFEAAKFCCRAALEV